jgi:hypothetical protein
LATPKVGGGNPFARLGNGRRFNIFMQKLALSRPAFGRTFVFGAASKSLIEHEIAIVLSMSVQLQVSHVEIEVTKLSHARSRKKWRDAQTAVISPASQNRRGNNDDDQRGGQD